MKFERLDLIAYGPFTGQSLEFPERAGFHLIHGPNEAGKSSALRAIADVLFGIPVRTNDNFLHPYKQLRIGLASVNLDGKKRDVVRRKANSQALREADDQTPVDDSAWQRHCGGMDRETFLTMFGIDHPRLRQGGEEVVRGQGNLGQLLFSAHSGVADLRKSLQSLTAASEQLFKPTKKSSEMLQLIEQYQTAQQEVKAAQVSVETWREQERQLNELEERKASLDHQLKELRLKSQQLKRVIDSQPAILQWRTVHAELKELESIPELPQQFERDVQAALTQSRQFEQQRVDAERELAEVREKIAELTLDESTLAEGPAIEALRTELGSYLKAQQDRPKVQSDMEAARSDAEETFRSLGRTGSLEQVDELRVPVDAAVQIQSLGNQHEGLVERKEGLHRDCERLRQTLKRIDQQLEKTAENAGLGDFKSAVRKIQSRGDLWQELSRASTEVTQLTREAESLAGQLPLISADLERLESLRLPLVATVERYEQRFRECETERHSLIGRCEEERQQEERLVSQLAELESGRAIPTEEDLSEARERRQRGWKLILQAWKADGASQQELSEYLEQSEGNADLARAYELAVGGADQLVDTLRSDADRVATKARLQSEVEESRRRQSGLRSQISQAEELYQTLAIEWQEHWETAGLTALPPGEMLKWLRQYEQIKSVIAQLRRRELEQEQLTTEVESARKTLEKHLQACGIDFPAEHEVAELMQRATVHVEKQSEDEVLRKRLVADRESVLEELDEAGSRLNSTENALSEWKNAWEKEMTRLGLTGEATPAQANRVLSELTDLFRHLHTTKDKEIRIQGIDADSSAFEERVAELVSRLDSEFKADSVEQMVHELTRRLNSAVSTRDRYEVYAAQAEQKEKQINEASHGANVQQAMLQQFCEQASCSEIADLQDVYRQSARKQALQQQAESWRAQIQAHSAGREIDQFVAEVLEYQDEIDELPGELKDLEGQINGLNAERDQLIERISTARLELNRIDGSAVAAARAEDSESLASSLERKIERLVSLRIALATLNAAVERHREKSQGPVLEQASRYFQQMTCGSFAGLQADFDTQGNPVVKGVRTDSNASLEVQEMSDGTCDQLYLALRLASLEAWLESHAPFPFIVDDILLNFDDERSIATMKILIELSQRTQVLFFTHHQHLVDLLASTDEIDSETYHVHRLGRTAVPT